MRVYIGDQTFDLPQDQPALIEVETDDLIGWVKMIATEDARPGFVTLALTFDKPMRPIDLSRLPWRELALEALRSH